MTRPAAPAAADDAATGRASGPAGAAGWVLAPAKINLALHVVGRRADGYHLLDSLVVFVSAADLLCAWPARSGGAPLAIDGPFSAGLSAGADNLVARASAAFAARFPDHAPLPLSLTKRLPLASGIGGGSADGAAALRLLAHLAGGIETANLADLALGLGADGPMCLRAAPLRARGIGERLDDWPAPPRLDLVLVNPGVAVATPAVFRRLDRADHPPLEAELPRLSDAAALAAYLRAETRNDLEAPAIAEAPVIAAAKDLISALPGCLLARMSGSGATVFGLFGDAAAAGRAAEAIRAARPDWWVEAVSSVPPVYAMARGPAQNM